MKIITGYKGEAHITPNEIQCENQGAFGTGSYVLNIGSKFTPTLISANELQIADGEGVMQGVHFRVDPGTYDSVTIENGEQGMNRKDLIVCRYTKDAGTGVEQTEWVVIKGTPAAGTATRPSATTGDIRTGSTTADMEMFEVVLSGINVTAVNALFSTIKTMSEMQSDISTNATNISTLNTKWKVGAAPSSISIAAGSYAEQTYSFGMTFSSVPNVMLSLFGTGDNGYRGSVSAFVTNVTTTQVTVRLFNNSAAALSVGLQWLAIL